MQTNLVNMKQIIWKSNSIQVILPLNEILKLHMLTIIVSSVFEEDGKYYPHVFLDECLHEV